MQNASFWTPKQVTRQNVASKRPLKKARAMGASTNPLTRGLMAQPTIEFFNAKAANAPKPKRTKQSEPHPTECPPSSPERPGTKRKRSSSPSSTSATRSQEDNSQRALTSFFQVRPT